MCSLILLPKSGFGVKLFSYLGCKTGWTAKLVHELEEFLAKFWRFLHVIWEAKFTFSRIMQRGEKCPVICSLFDFMKDKWVSSKLEFFENCFSLYQRSDL